MKSKGLKVLVTGSTGFIGSNLVGKLLSCEFEVYALIRPESSQGTKRLANYKELKYIYSSSSELIYMNNIPQFDICFNLASYGVDYRQQKLSDMINGNIKFTLNIVEFCKNNKTKLLINTGSCFEYGSNDLKQLTEKSALNPHSIYGSAKAASVIMANTYAKLNNVRMITVRPFGIYGPNEGLHKLIPQLIETIIKNKKIDMTLGEQVRDYLYVEDLVDAYIELAISDNIVNYHIYNICSSEEVTIKQLVHALCEICGYNESNFNYGALPYRDNEVMYFVGDNTKVCNVIKWRPKVSLKEGLKMTIEHYKTNT